MQIVKQISDALWGYILLFLLVGTGIFFTFYLGFPQLANFGKAMKQVFGPIFSKEKAEKSEGSMSSFQALATAIAAQVGTGNVAGVATAIISGGPGAVFWMWVSAFLGMATIFSEAILAQRYRIKKDGEYVGGPAYYISRGLGSKPLAVFFSITIIIALGFVGNMVQSNSISASVSSAFNIPPIAVGIVVALAAAAVFMGGMERIANFASLVVPFMAVLYILGSIIAMIIFKDQVGPAFTSIIQGAFNPQALGGGIAGVTVKKAMQFGVARGLFSNEAGMGSTPHAHAAAHVKHPVEQGMVAFVGVFIDTILVCTATALTILVTKANLEKGLDGPLVTQHAFTTAFGNMGTIFLAVCLTFFAFTTIIGWYYFGETNIKFLFGKNGLLPYRLLVILFIVLGSLLTKDIKGVWDLADFTNGIMVFPNLIALLFLAPQVKRLYKHFKAGKAYTPEMSNDEIARL